MSYRRLFLPIVASLLLVLTLFAPTTGATATGTRVDLAISSASFVGNAKNIAASDIVVVSFTATNKGPATAPDTHIDITSMKNLSAAPAESYCVAANGGTLDADSPSCEPSPALPVGGHESSIVVLAHGAPGTTASITMCIRSFDPIIDPVPSNNCKTITAKN